jgi:SecD/SecF fusion protein
MKQKHLWYLLSIIAIVGLSVYYLMPPTGRDLLQDFQAKARNKDAAFSNIVARAQQLEKDVPNRAYGNLRDAIGTNEITKYFPRINTKGQKNPSVHVLNQLQFESAGKIKLGLDLQGGTSFLVGFDTSKLSTNADHGMALANAIEVLRKRVDKLGVAEPVLQPLAAENKILIQLPGLSESATQEAIRNLERAAFLEFRMVHPESAQLMGQGIIEPGYEVLKEQVRSSRGGEQDVASYLVKRGAERGLTGKYITRAIMTRNHVTNEPEISFELDTEGARLFADITREYSPKGNKYHLLAIVLDGELYSAPRINGPIEGGRGVIQGGFDAREALELANVLENPLEAPVKILDQRSVDPSLGKDSIRSGILSCVYGTLGVAVFMMFFYFFAGAVANFALMLNVVITMGVMCAFESTLTLPGIAGLVLSIGMAVDANVLIFERIREELAAGKTLKGALAAGYDRAFGTILDSHVTTLISALILYKLGTGPIQGFGVTLTIGVAASLFTALLVTRLIFDFLIHKQWMTSIKMMPVMRLTKVDFMAWAKPAFVLSAVLILAGVGYGVFGRGHKMFGVDFAGGDALTLSFTQRVEVDKLRAAVGKLGVGEPTIQYQKPVAGGRETLRILAAYDSGKRVEEAVKKEFPQAAFQVLGTEKVGPSVGREIQESAVVSLFLAMLGILVYVALRYEFSFAVAAVLATAHDFLFTLAIFSFAGLELSSTAVAAFLTIIGYSINDKIVILDRIREDLKLGVRGSFREIINLALNQTLSRTLITGGSVILATLSLLIFGGGVINDFAFTFLVGILAGTYSSIYIACAVLLWWNKGQRPRIGSGVSMETAASARETAGVRN